MIKQRTYSIIKTLVLLGLVLIWNISTYGGENSNLLPKNIDITGTVTDLKGEPLPGVGISVKGTKAGTTTNTSGKYSISNVPDNAVLIFSFLGFKSREIPVNKKTRIDVSLQEDTKALDEVVVVGYGTVKKSHLTGSISKLKNENLDEVPTSRLDNALIGKIAGVNISNTNPEAGGAPEVRIRGFSSISADAQPLVVVDGYPVPDGLAFVNQQDVESIEVLKDAASASIYGSRAANGVILITTKKGVADKPKYAIKSYYGTKQAYKLNSLMTFSEYATRLFNEAALRATDPTVPEAERNLITPGERAAYILENQISGTATNWQKEGLQDASIYNIQMNVSGGNKNLRYYVSGNVQKDEGIMKFSENNRVNAKTSIEGALNKKVNFSVNFNPSYTKTQRPAVNFTDYTRFYSFLPAYHTPFTAAFVNQNSQWANIKGGDYAEARHFSDINYYGTMPDGSYWTSIGTSDEYPDPFNTSNNTPISIASREKRQLEAYRLLGGGDLTFKLHKNLTFKTSIGGYLTYQDDNTYTKRNARKDGDVNEASLASRRTIDYLWENTLNYNYTKKNHNFAGLLGYTAQKTNISQSYMVGRNFPTDDNFETLKATQVDQSLTYTVKEPIGLVSYFGRATYDYKGIYLFSSSIRTDGSSYFNSGNKYGWFPSVSAGWRINREQFMQDVNWISNLKLKGSYGITGNNRISSFSYLDLLYPGNYSFGSSSGSVNPGLSPNSNVLANPDITWELTNEYNAGVDAGFLKDRYTLTVDFYNKVTDKLLFREGAMAFTGSNEHWVNKGKVRNQGVEIDFGSTNVRNKNLTWKTGFNLSVNRNKLLAIGGQAYQYNYGERNELYAAIVGQPAIQFYGYKTDGIWTSQAEIDEVITAGQTSALSKYYQPGGLKIVDVNGDNKIDIDDRTTIGKPFPDFIWGVNNTVKYKNFDLSVLIQGSQGGKLVNGDAFYNEQKKFNTNFTEGRWVSAANPGDGKTPYFGLGTDWLLTDYIIESASYACIRTAILGYTLPPRLNRLSGLKSTRVYVAADNLLYLMGDSYRGINPESRISSGVYSSPLVGGYQRGSFPLSRTFTFGIDVNF